MSQSDPIAPPRGRRLFGLSLLALGIVFGDIGTSPLYAVRDCFSDEHGGLAVTHDNVLGILSLIVWSLVLVVCVKYLLFIMRADNRGEGGILALYALIGRPREKRERDAQRSGRLGPLAVLGLFGAALLYGDGAITPAVSVLSAVEGIKVATPALERWIIPITLAILVGLFAVQSRGTARIGSVFGPIMLVWFVTIAALGVAAITRNPEVLTAFMPSHGVRFFLENGLHGYLVLGTVFLVVTGGEALYADMGHLGLRPIRVAWFGLVLVALTLNYLGQGALLLADPSLRTNPFYAMVSPWAVMPLVVLATAATVIASQALISGVFSLTMQAVQLGFCPRLQIEHTSEKQYGQIFIAPINWGLMVATIGLVIGFRTSSNLTAAYGVAVTGTMAITTVLFAVVARQRWSWPMPLVLLVAGSFLVVDLAFFGACLAKIPEGGWFPLVVAAFVFTLLATWKRGRALVGERLRKSIRPLPVFMKAIEYDPPTRVPGTAVFMTGNPDGVPLALLHNLLHNKVLHRRVVMLSVQFDQIPHVADEERIEIEERTNGFVVVTASYGFMEEPDVPAILAACEAHGLKVRPNETTFFLGRETLVPRPHKKGFALWRQRLFAFMARNAQPAVAYFRIPPHRVIEVGQQIEL